MFPLIFSHHTLEQNNRNALKASNLYESPNSYLLELEVPGFSEEDIHISLSDNRLTIAGEKEGELPEGFEKPATRTFSKSFRLKTAIEEEQISAVLKNGLLHLTLPKRNTLREIKIKAA